METAIREQFSQDILEESCKRYGLSADDLDALNGFESFIYKCRHQDRDRILRLSHTRRRSENLIAGELDWLRHLASHDLTVCDAVPSEKGNLLESIPSQGTDHFLATLFNAAPGQPATGDLWNPPLFEDMGRILGRMHALAQDYQPSNASWRRPTWKEEITELPERYIGDQPRIIDQFHQTVSATESLPTSRESYGLVHLDFHRSNFHVDEGTIHLFDFDDCQYSWFADDLAMALFYAVAPNCTSEEDLSNAATFFHHLLQGYRSEHALADDWLEHLPLFLKRREIDLYIVIHRSLDTDKLEGWPARYMEGRASRIESAQPYLPLDFSQFAVG